MNQGLAEKGTATLEPGAFARRWQDPARFLQILDDPWFKIVVGIQNLVSVATMDFWRRRDCITLHLPITTNAISSPMGLGSDSLPVEIDLFGQRTYLADSMQFMLEYGCRFHPEGCYYVMPSFRGESADETHLSQFYHSEAELCLGLEDQIDVAESYFRYVTQAVLERFQGELGTAGIGTSHLDVILSGRAIPRLTFQEAARILRDDSRYVIRMDNWRTLNRAGERELMRYCGGAVWVTHWDHLAVPFYQAFAEDGSACNADLLIGVGEVIGLGQRHSDGAQVRRALDLHRVDQGAYQWYIDLKDRKPLLTSGFGMGVERYLLWLLSHSDIRDLQLLPRMNGYSIIP